MEAMLFNNNRVKEVASFIADELLKILADRSDSHISEHISKNCRAYKKGLTNGERRLAMMRALSMVQLDVASELAGMTHTVDEDLCDDDEMHEPAKYAPESTWKTITRERYEEKCGHTSPTSTRESIGKGGYDDRAFLVGEPSDHDAEGRPLYYAFLSREYDGVIRYFESDTPMSVHEFQRVSFITVPHPKPDAEAADAA